MLDLDRELAAEEHRQGRPHDEYGHCDDCNRAVVIAIQAACAHEDYAEIQVFGDRWPSRTCFDCGLVFYVIPDDAASRDAAG